MLERAFLLNYIQKKVFFLFPNNRSKDGLYFDQTKSNEIEI